MTLGYWSQSTEGLVTEVCDSFTFILGALSSKFVGPPFSADVGASRSKLRCAGRCVIALLSQADLLKETRW